MTTEQWRPVPNFDDYEVSSLGRVMSYRRGRPQLMRTPVGNKGYRAVRLSRGTRHDQASFELHRLVALAFLGEAPKGVQVRHLDGDRLNNELSNLQYGTPGENNQDTLRHGTHRNASKSHCPQGHRYDEANTYIGPSGRRECRICRRAHSAAYRRRRGTPLRVRVA